MAQLSSPGVSVEVKDDSIYSAAGAGTVPLIFVATAANKLNGSLTGIAPGTLKTDKDYGKVRLFTSPKDLTDTFGVPVFKTDSNNNPIHGAEQNEYGLQAAYKYLNVSNRAFVVRADLDLAELNASGTIPVGTPSNNTFWLDTASTNWGIFEWNSDSADKIGGQTFTHVEPLVVTDAKQIDEFGAPRTGFGAVGTYAVAAVSSLITYWYKSRKTSTWVEVGSDNWKESVEIAETTISELTFPTPIVTTDSITITLYNPSTGAVVNAYPAFTGVTSLAQFAQAITTAGAANGLSATAEDYKLQIYSRQYDVDFTGTTASTASKIGLVISPVARYVLPELDVSTHLNVPSFKRKDFPFTDPKNILPPRPAAAVGRPTGSIWIKTTATNNGSDWNVNRYDTDVKAWITSSAQLYPNNESAILGLDPTTGGLEIPGNTVYVKYNTGELSTDHANFKLYRRIDTGKTEIVSKLITRTDFADNLTYKFDIYESSAASNLLTKKEIEVNINYNPTDSDAVVVESVLDAFEAQINTSVVNTNVHASQRDGKLVISHIRGGEIKFDDGQGSPIAILFDPAKTANFYQHPVGGSDIYLASLWTEFGTTERTSSFIKASPTKLTGPATNGLMWYDANYDQVDIMVNDGSDWLAYRNYDHGSGRGATNKKGPILSGSEPETQNDTLKSPLVEGDLWIDTSDHENYPVIYRYANFSKKWIKIDNADQTTEDGIIFADARWNTDGISPNPSTIVQLLGGTESEMSTEAINAANFLDFDAPNPVSYPKGILLWNLRRSGYNVKKYHTKYVDVLSYNPRNGESMRNYYPNRWVTESGNNEDGSGSFGRKAQRKVVVQALQALINSNQEIREEEYRVFNLIACPGYPELVGEMVNLNVGRGQTAFVIGDTPARLKSDATTLLNWGNNQALAVQDSDEGLVTNDPYLAFFYPWGYTSDNTGKNIVVPPSHMMLTTIALSDAASFPWFAPAGTQRGAIKNADSVGYLGKKDEWVPVALNNGQRDTLASIKVNPITYLAGVGLVNYGQYTRSPETSSLDRINVARLIVSLRRRLDLMSRPYLFQPNDDATRKQIKHAAESMLLELMGQRAIYDYVVVCDSSNNTPARIDKSELYLDIAIEPTKAVEFIYIPLRLKNTGEIKALGI